MNLFSCFRRAAAGAALVMGMASAVWAQNVPVYMNGLENGWQNWSWCTTDFANTQYLLSSGKDSIKATITGAWQGLYFGLDIPIPTQYFSSVQFYINGGPTAGRQLNFQAVVDGVGKTALNLNNYIPGGQVPAKAWKLVTIPFAAMGLSSSDQLGGFWLQDSSGGAQPAFWVGNVNLVSLAPPNPIDVTVNAGTATQAPLNANQFGVNTAVWDSGFGNSTHDGMVASGQYKSFRFPGGSLADTFNWQTNQTTDGTTWGTSFDTFAATVVPLGGAGVITTNYGTGTSAEAAAWVKYSNKTKNYGFKYWEVGNECYGTWETDNHQYPNDPYTYAQQFALYQSAMKAIDPTVKVGAVISPGEDDYANYTTHPAKNPVTGAVHNGWTAVMLATLASLKVVPDFVIYHRYPFNPGWECDFSLLQINPSFASDISQIRTDLTDYYTGSGVTSSGTKILCTENNSQPGVEGKQMVSLVNGLFLADTFGTAINTECAGYFWWDLINGQTTAGNNAAWLYGWREYGDEGQLDPSTYAGYPMFYIERLLAQFAAPGDTPIKVTSSNGILSAYATKRSDGTVRLLLINKHPLANVLYTLNLTGMTPKPSGAVYRYGIPQDTAAETGSGSLDFATYTLTGIAATTHTSVPPYSATVIVLTPKT